MKVCLYLCKMNKILLEVIGLSYTHSQSGAYVLILEEKNEKVKLPVIIGEPEAQSIALAIEGLENRRPLTHDLFKTFATSFDINITEVIINRFKDGLFYSELHCFKDGKESIIDARTSDAIAIALRFDAPIYTYGQVIEEAGVIMDDLGLSTDFDSDSDLDKNESEDFYRYEITELEYLLKEAIEIEDYDKASVLRDIINDKKSTP